MWKPSVRQRKSMERLLKSWEASLDLAASYLVSRAIGPATAQAFRLGVVACPEPGYETYVGRLAIPYIDRLGVCGFQFRCLTDHDCKAVDCKKYMQLKDHKLGLFNILGLADSDAETVHVCEGEIDCITLSQVIKDEPIVALSGVSKWMPHFVFHFQGFERVLLWRDGDAAADKMVAKFRQELKNVDTVDMPSGEDVNSLYCLKGPDGVKALCEGEADVQYQEECREMSGV